MKNWLTWLPVVAASFFTAFVFFTQQFPAGLSEVKQNIVSASVGNVNSELFSKFRVDEGYTVFPLAEKIKSFFPDSFIFDSSKHRIPNLILSLTCIVLFYLLTKSTKGAVLVMAITPWFIWSTVFDFKSLLTLALLLGAFVSKNRLVNIALLVAASFASIAGLVAGAIYLASKTSNKIYFLGLALLLLGFVLRFPLANFKPVTFFAEGDYSLERSSFDVLQRFNEETVINNHVNIIPLSIKRISYNKYFFLASKMAPQFTKILNWEYLASPAQIRTTVAKNLWGEKRIPLIFFWQIPLVFIGIIYFSKINPELKNPLITLAVAGIVSTGLSPASQIESNGLILVFPIVILTYLGWQQLSKFKLVSIGLLLVIVVGVISTYHHFLKNEMHWRDNRPFVFESLINEVNKFNDQEKITITNMLGPTNFYYAWINKTDLQEFWDNYNPTPTLGRISFKHFDLSSENIDSNSGYIGLPGEFLGNRSNKNNNMFLPGELPTNLVLINSIAIKDAVSFGNGNFIWTVKAY